jgi:glycine oxidase
MTSYKFGLVVVGAGAVGLAVALECRRRGHDVALIDEGAPFSASAAAAGMTAPVMETLTDPPMEGQTEELARAGLIWPEFAREFGLSHAERGGLWLAPEGAEARAAKVAEYFEAHGLPVGRISAEAARDLAPWVRPSGRGPIFFAPREGAIAPDTGLAEMEAAFAALGGVRLHGVVRQEAGDLFVGDHPLVAARLVIAGGMGCHRLDPIAPELAGLVPIRGQIAHFASTPDIPSDAPFVRGPGAYVAPQTGGGARVGATMERGETSTTPDPEVIARLVAAASAYAPSLAGAAHAPRAGVRATTPDDRPLIGPSAREGVFLATGVRRNGWLLAPLAARMIADYLEGGAVGPEARAVDPRRFS